LDTPFEKIRVRLRKHERATSQSKEPLAVAYSQRREVAKADQSPGRLRRNPVSIKAKPMRTTLEGSGIDIWREGAVMTSNVPDA